MVLWAPSSAEDTVRFCLAKKNSMRNPGIGWRGGVSTIAPLLILMSSASWAADASCATKATLASYGTGAANGCYEIDQTFSNFGVTSGSAGVGSTVQSTSTDDIAGTNTFSAVTTPWTVTSTFSGATAADWTITGAGGVNTEGTITYITNTSQAEFTVPTGYPTVTAGDHIAISSLSLTASASTGTSATDTITITETFCIGTGACTTGATGNEITLTATYSGSGDTTATYGCTALTDAGATCGSASSATPITVTFASQVTTLNFSDNYNLVAHGTTTDTLNDFFNTFNTDEIGAPEPSTFLLLGAGLAGFGMLRVRAARRRNPAGAAKVAALND
jgi:hypothetical protein